MQSIPLIGGQFSNFMEEDVVNVDWTRDGSRAVYHTRQSGDPFYVAEPNASAGDPILVEDAGYHQHYPIWSFDEQWIYLVRGRPTTGDMDLWRVRPDGRDAKRLTFDKKFVAYPTPIDEVTVLYVAREIDGSGPWLWALDTETETSRRVTSGLAQYTSVSASEDGRRLVVTRADPQASLWRVPILRDGIATESDVSSFSEVPSLRALAPRIREAHIFYLSSGPRGDVLWRVGDSKAVEVRSPGHSLLWPPSISPDGTSVALALREESRMSLHLISSDGAWSERLSDEIDVRGTSSWSPKGDWIVVGGDDGNGAGLFKIRVSDGTAERIATGEAMNPVWSPVDDLIVYAGLQVNTFSPLVAIQSDGEPVELPPIEVRRGGERFRFLPNGRGLVYMQGLQHAQDFWLLDLTTMTERRLTRLEGVDTMRAFDITPDGKTIVFDRLRQNSDIVLIELGNESEAAGKH